MQLLILPEYDADTRHVMVDTVYGELLPGLGHRVHMIRPVRSVREPTRLAQTSSGGRLVAVPVDIRTSRLDFFVRLARRRQALRTALACLGDVALDAVILRNDWWAALQVQAFARARRIPFVFQISSPEPEFRIAGRTGRGTLRRLPDLSRGLLDLAIRERVSRRSDVVLAISVGMRRYLVERRRLDPRRVFALPMGYGSNPNPGPKDIEWARASMNVTWRYTLLYSGVIDGLRDPAFMLDVLAAVRDRGVDAGLVVLTYQTDERRQAFEADGRERRLPVKVMGPFRHDQVPAFLSCADLVLSPLPPRLEYVISSPTKTVEALGAGIPVVGSVEVEEHRRLLTEVGGGVAVGYSAEAFSDAIVSLLQDEERRRTMGMVGREWTRRTRSYLRLTRYLALILERAVSGSSMATIPPDPDSPLVDDLLQAPRTTPAVSPC